MMLIFLFPPFDNYYRKISEIINTLKHLVSKLLGHFRRYPSGRRTRFYYAISNVINNLEKLFYEQVVWKI